MIRQLLLAGIAILCSTPSGATADAALARIQQQLNTPGSLSGEFTQQKHIREFDLTIDSSGRFSYTPDGEILWETREPIASELIMSNEHIVSRQDGREISRIDASAHSVVTTLANLFFSVLTARWDSLERYFDLTATTTQDSWTVHLNPTDTTISTLFEAIELSGDRHIGTVLLREKNGDTTRITFDKLVSGDE